VEAEAPAEMVFTPDGGQVLITYWPNYGSGRIIRVDLKSGDATTLLGDDHFSYNGPVFAPDGRTLLVVREDLDAARWSIVALPWPAANSPTAIITGPRGIRLSEPIFLGDGNRFLFRQRDALASATLDGRNVEALFGELDQKDVEGPFLRNMGVRRSNPVRPGWLPHVVTRYLATTQPRERASPTAPPQADVVLYDLQTRQRTVIPLANGQVKRVVVVE
jgi:hypothetical protein